jgi:hypothetical protein
MYEYDINGKHTQLHDLRHGREHYHYDPSDQLIRFDGVNVVQFVHDPADSVEVGRFFSSSSFNAPSATIYPVYQQNIDWDLPVNTRNGIKTNLELALDGKVILLLKMDNIHS